MAKKRKNNIVSTAISLGVTTLVGAAIVEQLRRPPDERTWHGKVLGFPYDFRPPTLEKVRNTVWNKDTSKIFLPHAFGIGWSINFYPLVHPKPANQQISDTTDLE